MKAISWMIWFLCFGTPAFAQQVAWQRFTIDGSLRGADGARLADINGDGRSDIVTGWEESGIIRVYLHPGFESVQSVWPHVHLGSAPSVEDAVFVNLNADGFMDVLGSCEGGEQSLIAFLAPESFTKNQQADAWTRVTVPASQAVTRWMFACPIPPSAEDDDTKHSRLVAVASKSPNGLVGLLDCHATDPKEWTLRRLTDAQWVMSLMSLDMDEDGDADLLYSDRKGAEAGIYWLENLGNFQEWKRHLVGARGREVMFMAFPTLSPAIKTTADSSDHDLYVAVKAHEILRYHKTLTNQGVEWSEERIAVQPNSRIGTAKAVAIGNLDSDPEMEIVFSCEAATPPRSGIIYLDRQADRWKMHELSGPDGIKFDLLKLVDLDSDGDLDVITCEERHGGRGLGVIWYANPLYGKD